MPFQSQTQLHSLWITENKVMEEGDLHFMVAEGTLLKNKMKGKAPHLIDSEALTL
jgi:hypothetical protein